MNEYSSGVRGSDAMMGFVLGAIVGAGVALLFAPAPGSDTRRRVGETASRLGHAAREKIGEVKNDLKRKGETLANRGQDAMSEFGQGMESEARHA